jgi:hypothetical protein
VLPLPYVHIDLSRVTVLRCREQLGVAIWEHACDEAIKKQSKSIDWLEFICRGKTMTSDDKTRDDAEANFSYGVRELRQSTAARELRVEKTPVKAANDQRGFDPYNTSGSFDRKKNWARVGKR